MVVSRADSVDLRGLKQFVVNEFPVDSQLKALILSEPDKMSVEEYVVQVGTWLKLARFES